MGANIAAFSLIPYMKAISNVMNEFFPERLDRLVLFPLPTACKFLWNVIKKFLDPVTAEKIIVVSGPAAIDSPAPIKVLSEYVDVETLKYLELVRKSTFVP